MQELSECKKVLIEVNQTCNLNCTYCFYRDYGRSLESLNVGDIENMLNKCPKANEFYLTGGECFFSKEIDQIIEVLHQKGKVIAFTNGVILNKYDDDRLLKVVGNVDRFIISFDSFDFDNYLCRRNLDETLKTIKRILLIDKNKVEVKVCVSNFNVNKLDTIFKELISLGVKYLSVNFVFDIQNSELSHEVVDSKNLWQAFKIIEQYKEYFNESYIEVLKDLYINNRKNKKFPCIADKEYFYLDCKNNFLICPGNCKKLGCRGDWEKCYSKECANEWEIMYTR